MTGDVSVLVVPPNPLWATEYQLHERQIRAALRDSICLLEHIGSTAVPGLAAKPIIDILLVVEEPKDEDSYVPPLSRAGYRLHRREPELDEHRLLKGVAPDANVHIFPPSSREVQRYLRFRDRLRRDVVARLAYEQEKLRLASMLWPSTNHYADAKSEIVERLLSETDGSNSV